jgi:hypothetical protein
VSRFVASVDPLDRGESGSMICAVVGMTLLAGLTAEIILLVGGIYAAIIIGVLRRKDNPPVTLYCLGCQ